MRPPEITFPAWVARLRAALAVRAPRSLDVPSFRAAAVLVPFVARPEGPAVLLTRRASTLPHHRGEIAFPGGRLEPGEGAEAAALREAAEEIGLDAGAAEVELLGRLDDYPSVARYVVTPVVAAIAAPPPAWRPAAGEVDEAFEVPVARLVAPGARRASLLDPARVPAPVLEVIARHQLRVEEVDAATGHWRVWSFEDDPARVVWGLTARILADLLDRVPPDPSGP